MMMKVKTKQKNGNNRERRKEIIGTIKMQQIHGVGQFMFVSYIF